MTNGIIRTLSVLKLLNLYMILAFETNYNSKWCIEDFWGVFYS